MGMLCAHPAPSPCCPSPLAVCVDLSDRIEKSAEKVKAGRGRGTGGVEFNFHELKYEGSIITASISTIDRARRRLDLCVDTFRVDDLLQINKKVLLGTL